MTRDHLSTTLISWASILEPNTREQAVKTATMPFIYPHLALMPDAHLGIIWTDAGRFSPAESEERVCRRSRTAPSVGFMGKRWDAFVPPVAVWDECLRVLKPGGHLLAFAGSRTQDLMALGIRLAGFDIRDAIAWLYASGFPKSLDVSDAMARRLAGEVPDTTAGPAIPAGVYEVTAFLRRARVRAGWSARRIDALFGTNGMASHWTSMGTQPAVPSLRQWAVLKDALGFDDTMDELVAQLASSERPGDWGQGADIDGSGFLGSLRKDEAHDPPGPWGTALKPGYEPIVVARRPISGTVAANILTNGTGALNIDGCRTPMSAEDRAGYERASESFRRMSEHRGDTTPSGETRKASSIYGAMGNRSSPPNDAGRWPTNVVIDETTGEALGPAAKYFPTFKFAPKAPANERPSYNGIAHPTVKPLDLMRWLVRLATPPGGVVLEPFAGSGTTAEACVIEGLRCIAIEREATYLPLIVRRLTKPIEIVLDLGDLT